MIAAQDRLLLQHEIQLVGITKSINKFENIFRLLSLHLGRLQDRSSAHAVRKSSGLAEDSWSDESICDHFAANPQDIIWSLQENALDAIIRHYLNIMNVYVLHWHLRWEHSKRIGEGWFAEWPNSHRPLSTTWPWNIKPSLLVLWGVCWMFYGPTGSNKKRTTRNQRGAAPLSEDLRTGPIGSQSQPSRQESRFL